MPLQNLVTPDRPIPLFIEKCVDYIERTGKFLVFVKLVYIIASENVEMLLPVLRFKGCLRIQSFLCEFTSIK